MQQFSIGAIICLPCFAMVSSCGLSIPCLFCMTRCSMCGRSTSNILEVRKVLQERILHMRNGDDSSVSCFSAQYAAAECGARWCGDDGFSQEMMVWLEAIVWCQDCSPTHQISTVATNLLMISDHWYAKLNLLHVFISEFLDVSFQPIILAAQYWEYQKWNNLPSVNSWSQVNITTTDLLDNYVRTQHINFKGRKNLGFWIPWPQIDHNKNPIILELMAKTIAIYERHSVRCFSCTCLLPSDDHHVEDAISMMFGLFHRRWTTTPPLLIPRFKGGDTLSSSSVKVIRYLQLSSTPCVHTPDRLSAEPPAGHQLDRTSIEALEDGRCGNFEFELSADERTPQGSIWDLQHLLHEFRSSSCSVVHLGTYLSCSVESHVMLYHDL